MSLTTRTFNDFDTNSTPLSGDYLVGVCSNGSAEFKTTVSAIGPFAEDSSHNIFSRRGDNSVSNIGNSTISGGCQNVISTASGMSGGDVIAGGVNNCTDYFGGGLNTISGGYKNEVVSVGGEGAPTYSNTIGGGACNCISAYSFAGFNTIGGGEGNCVSAFEACGSTIAGGVCNHSNNY